VILDPRDNPQIPVYSVSSPAIDSLGDLAAELTSAYGLVPDDWQKYVLEDWLAVAGDHWANLTCGMTIPRQNGKNAAVEIRELFGMIGRGEKILHTAHQVKTAQKHFKRLRYFFGEKADDPSARFPELNALVESVRKVNGQEAIFLKNGGSVELAARSKNSGRGFTVDVLVMDEAQELNEEELEALLSTTSAAPLGDPQWIYTGTPPGPTAAGDAFSRVRKDALFSGSSVRTCWHEWSPPGNPESLSDIDMDSRSLWIRVNPGIEAGRLQLSVVEGEYARYTADGFARERLGWWASSDNTRRFISVDNWRETAVSSLPETLSGPRIVRSLGVAFSKDGSRAAVAGAIYDKSTGIGHVELIDSTEEAFSEMASSQLAAWLYERRMSYSMVGISGRSGSLSLSEDLKFLKPPRNFVHVLDNREYFTACSGFYNAIRGGLVTHPAVEDDSVDTLDDSVSVSDKKIRSQDGAWGWESTRYDGDEVPLEAVSVALWAARVSKRRPGKAQEVFA